MIFAAIGNHLCQQDRQKAEMRRGVGGRSVFGRLGVRVFVAFVTLENDVPPTNGLKHAAAAAAVHFQVQSVEHFWGAQVMQCVVVANVWRCTTALGPDPRGPKWTRESAWRLGQIREQEFSCFQLDHQVRSCAQSAPVTAFQLRCTGMSAPAPHAHTQCSATHVFQFPKIVPRTSPGPWTLANTSQKAPPCLPTCLL